jgi:hypothetical protein
MGGGNGGLRFQVKQRGGERGWLFVSAYKSSQSAFGENAVMPK